MVLLPPSPCSPPDGGVEARSVSELRALSVRQQQQLSWQQQQLVAREQRLRFLRQAGPPGGHHEPQEMKLRRLRAQLDQQQAGNASLGNARPGRSSEGSIGCPGPCADLKHTKQPVLTKERGTIELQYLLNKNREWDFERKN